MRTKTLISLAVIAALPITAQATDPVGPARDDSNSPVIATASGPYQIATKTSADESHIATTAYVKGAYNDAIAAVNKVANTSQERMYNVDTGDLVIPSVMGASDFEELINEGEWYEGLGENQLVSTGAMVKTVIGINNNIDDLTSSIGSVEDEISSLQEDVSTLSNKRVEIYTTWNNDNAKTQVAFVNAPAQQ